MLCSAFVFFLTIGWQTAKAATSVSQFGITWTFSEDKTTGQFANGDWWVVGPVTITQITPADANGSDSTDMHGTMINPSVGIQNGWDSRIKFASAPNGYDPALNIAKRLPYTVPANTSVCSVKSYETYATGDNPQMETMAVLTVLPSAPAAGSFRPPFMGTNKAVEWNESQLNYSALGSLPVVANTPALATVASYFERPWVEKEDGWLGRYFHPGLNHPFQNRGTVGTYGREMAHTAADGLLSLQLNYTNAQKRLLLVRMVQAGIDIYGTARIGGYWSDGGGHNPGRKMVLLLAGKVLNSQKILDYGNAAKHRIFQEDMQTFYVTAADVARVHIPVNNAPVQDYVAADIGLPEWGFNHSDQPQYDNKLWTALYREVVGPCTLGHILTARIMGLQSAWNNSAAFDYWDRWYSLSGNKVSTSTNQVQPFVSAMWKAYRGTVISPPPAAAFAINDRISTIRNTNVRATGTLSGTLLGVQITGSLGTIIEGPVVMDAITWWRVNYDSGADGWSGEDNFAKSSVGPPGPTAPLAPLGVDVSAIPVTGED
jgi:hypothetical protein